MNRKIKFVDREEELREFEGLRLLSTKKLFLVALYGLRRVGKTRLLLEYTKNDGLYFFVNKSKTSSDLLLEYQEMLRRNNIITELEVLSTWDIFIETLLTRKTPPIIFDEFQNFTYVEPSIFGIIQKNIDLNEDKPGFIILSGSLIGLMKNLFMNSKEPLYGRIKKGIKLEPLSLSACLRIGEELGLDREDLVKLYCVFGGYPKYYVAIEDYCLQGRRAEEILDSLLFAEGASLEDEVNSILSQEFGGRSGIYYSILEAIGNGSNTISTIAGYTGTQATSLTRQIAELRDYFELIEFEKPYRGKRGIYRIKHPLVDFWFSQIQRNSSYYIGRNPTFIESMKSRLDTIIGRAFERVAAEFVVSKLKLVEARRQWGRVAGAGEGKDAYEIDLIGRSVERSFVFEFKWSKMEPEEALDEISQLKQKTMHMDVPPRDPTYVIVAREIRDKRSLLEKGYIAYDVEDF